ncbi:hypothetical protein FE634_17565 [Nocardioides dongxiaopingii]|uniref:hypothetical protein n=1 Tax=Nocardioides sp. S-1144 TaxID=2582905 RepID=UPI00110EBEFB|nr:hypothetical protein [Nocardioides sp. S-1144]QCW51769.1 hypothetical protein FE634_17565 [Nocardioides sp. S-1144]
MTYLLVASWTLVAVLAAIALTGSRRWHRNVTAWTRPGAAEPAPEGHTLLDVRNWAALVVVGGFLLVVTLDHVRLSEEELEEATDLAVGLASGPGVTAQRIAAEAAVLLDRDLEAVDVSDEVDPEGEDSNTWYEVRPARDSDSDDLLEPVVCVQLYSDTASANAGPCLD